MMAFCGSPQLVESKRCGMVRHEVGCPQATYRDASCNLCFVCLTLFVCSTPAYVCTGTCISYVPPSSAGETHPDGVRTAGQGRGWSRGRGHPEHGQRCAPCRHRCSSTAVAAARTEYLDERPVPPPAVFCVGGPVTIDGACEAPSPLSGPLPTREQRKRKRRVLSLERTVWSFFF